MNSSFLECFLLVLVETINAIQALDLPSTVSTARQLDLLSYPEFFSNNTTMAKKSLTLQPRVYHSPPFTVEASGYEPAEGETIPRRHPASKDELTTTPSEDVRTIFDILKRSADKFGNAKALGTRRLIKTHHENRKVNKTVDGVTREVDKVWTYFELSEYSYISFVEYEKLALEIGAGLRKLGLVKGDRLHLFAATRYDSLLRYSPRLQRLPTKRPLACYVSWRCVSIHSNRHSIRQSGRRRCLALVDTDPSKGHVL